MRTRINERKMTNQLAASIDASRTKEWLNPIAMSQLQAAVKAKKKSVTLQSGTFIITYGHMFRSQVLDTVTECVHLSPERGFSPCGYISLKKIKDFKFEDGE
jgi:hypothetical protein